MRYLKLFDSKKEEKFSDITEGEFIETEHQSLDFTDLEKRKIKSLVKENDKNRFRTPINIEYPKTTTNVVVPICFTSGRLAKVNCRIIVNYEPHKSSRTYRSSTGKGIPHDMVRTILPTSYISIIKDDDEWFYVRDFYQETTYQKDKRIKEDIEYYKCDQLDGLLDCIHACINK